MFNRTGTSEISITTSIRPFVTSSLYVLLGIGAKILRGNPIFRIL